MKKITIETISGLGNRMMALDSAISYCKKHNYELHLIWPLFRGLNIKFEHLFKIPKIVKSIKYPCEYSKSKIIINLKVGRRKLLKLFTDHRYDKIIDKRSPELITDRLVIPNCLTEGENLRLNLVFENIFIRTDRRFFNNPAPYAELVPTDEIRSEIEKIKSKIPVHSSIGLHIRRTDNIWAIEHSPMSAFLDKIQSTLDKDPQSLFYLATDSPEVETDLKNRFGKSIIGYKKPSLSRDEDLGMKHALIELLLLSSTKKIIGSYGSSFSVVASELGNIPLEIVTGESS